MIKPLLLLLLLLFLTSPLLGADCHFTWTPELRSAYSQAISLRFAESEQTLNEVRRLDPDNLLILHVENYLDFFRVYINEDEEEFRRLEKNKDRRLKEIETRGDPGSPYYLYLQADIRLMWALARLKFEQYSTSFFETNKAFKLLTENDKKFPGFLPNKKNLGILHAMVGTIPDNYKWAVEWFSSMEGTIDQGRGELEEVIDYARTNDFIYEEEIYVYYAYLLLHLGNDQEAAWRVINTANLKPKESPLACFIIANVAMRTDRGDRAISTLMNRPSGPAFHPFHYLDYMTGLTKLQRLDTDADVYLKRFVEKFKGRNFIKDAYQKLAWHSLINGDHAGYDKYMALCKSRGYTIVGSDRSANEEAKAGEVPAVDLLKARLLFDGGRFQEAYKALEGKTAEQYMSIRNQLEFTYRMGRILQKLERSEEALAYYQQTIDRGRDKSWYFACRAALEQGIIHEEAGRRAKAIAAYELCQSISPDDHKAGLHQQAKAGIKRMKN